MEQAILPSHCLFLDRSVASQNVSRPCELSPPTSFSRMFLSQDEAIQPPCPVIVPVIDDQPNHDVAPKRLKKRPLLLDARTELTDDELKVRMPTVLSKGGIHKSRHVDYLRRLLELAIFKIRPC